MSPIKIAISAVLIVPAIALLLFGPTETKKNTDGRVVVEYWEEWTDREGDAIRACVNDFNSTRGKEKGIFVNLLTTSGTTQKTLVSTAAGVPPDIAGLENVQLAQFAELDALETLDDLAAGKGITGDIYKKVFWDTCHYRGKMYALPSTPYNYAMFYDKRFFERNADKLRAAGLDPTRAPRTIAELDAYAACIDVVDPDGRIRVAGFMPLEPGWINEYYSLWFGGSWWDAKTERFDLLNPAVVNSFRWVQSYGKRLGQDAVSSFRSGVGNFDSPQNAFMAGQVAMEQQGTFMANFIKSRGSSELQKNWVATKFPGLTEELSNATYCDTNVFAIPRGARHKKEAFEFIAYMQEQGPMEKLCGLHCKISALKHVSDNFIRNNDNAYIKVFDNLADGPLAQCAPQCPILAEVTEEFAAYIQQIAKQVDIPPERGLAEMQERLQAKLDRFNAIQKLRRHGGSTSGAAVAN